MFARRRRSHGGYMIRVPASLDINVELNTKFALYYDAACLTNSTDYYYIKLENTYLTPVEGNLCESPELAIVQYLYNDNTLKDLYFTGNVIRYIAVTGPTISDITDAVQINVNDINITQINNIEYLNEKHLLVDKNKGTYFITYLYPIAVNISKSAEFKSVTQCKITNHSTLISTEYFSNDMCHNSVLDSQVHLDIPVTSQIQEVFDKYYIGYITETHKFLKLKQIINTEPSTVYSDNLQQVTLD